MTLTICIYTAIFGDYVPLQPIMEQRVPIDCYCLTDNSGLKAKGWQTLYRFLPRKEMHPRMRAKYHRMFPMRDEVLSRYDATIYIDGSLSVHSPQFAKHCLECLHGDMLLYRHPFLQDLDAEVNEARMLPKYASEQLDRQLWHYRRAYPAFFSEARSHYATGVLVRRNSLAVEKAMADWYVENVIHTYEDQISLPIVLWRHGVVPDTYPESMNSGDFFTIRNWRND